MARSIVNVLYSTGEPPGEEMLAEFFVGPRCSALAERSTKNEAGTPTEITTALPWLSSHIMLRIERLQGLQDPHSTLADRPPW
eukprot:m.247646 g.247646  ORF g.247646 m.247646 type:complete len:83 (+) comp26456_c0_seq1:796-1044(+)